MKIALITDQHFGVRNDSTQFHNYYEKFYSEVFFPTLEERGIKDIIELGDIFDRRKYINFDSLKRCNDYFFGPIYGKGINLHCIVGNHDTYFKNTNAVNAPYLLLGWMKDKWPCPKNDYILNTSEMWVHAHPSNDFDFDGCKIMFMPWINSSNYDYAMHTIKNSNADVCMGHLELSGFEMYKGTKIDSGMSHATFGKFDMVMSGHFHHKSSKDNIHYLGAPYEMTWSDYDDDRGFHIFDTKTRELEYIKNPYSMFHKVFYDDSNEDNIHASIKEDHGHLKDTFIKIVVKNKDNPYLFDLFVDSINQANPCHVQIVEDNLRLDMENADDIINEAEDTATIVNKYIDSLNLPAPKPVHDLFYDLYSEAISNE
jgi:hypothetical protein